MSEAVNEEAINEKSEVVNENPGLATFSVVLPDGYKIPVRARGVEWLDSRVFFIGPQGAPIATFNRDNIAGVMVGGDDWDG